VYNIKPFIHEIVDLQQKQIFISKSTFDQFAKYPKGGNLPLLCTFEGYKAFSFKGLRLWPGTLPAPGPC